LAALISLVSAGSLLAHHSLGNYDTTKPFRVKGTIVQFQQINPHSFLFIEQKDDAGQIHRFAVEGPSVLQLKRTSRQDVVKVGDYIEVCGYLPKESVVWQIASPENATSLSGRLLNAELIVTPDGIERPWGDYGFHKCFAPGFKDQHTPR
jgi:hypothetical protein